MKIFEPYTLNKLHLKNRLVMAPMCTDHVVLMDGIATEFHHDHYVARAMGGVGLIIVEATAIAENGKIYDQDLGLYNDYQIDAMKKIVDGVHRYHAKIAIQLNHAGRKCKATNKVDTIIGPSKVPYSEESLVPKEMSEEEIVAVVEQFKQAAIRADKAGFDAIEIHAAHGFLINQFISPSANLREDKYKEPSLFLKMVLEAVHNVWPQDKGLWIRVSAKDYNQENGYDVDHIINVINQVREHIDCIHVSSGGVTPTKPRAFFGYQVPFATAIKKACDLPVIAVGAIESEKLADFILESEASDLIALGRPLLYNPNWLVDVALKYESDKLPESLHFRAMASNAKVKGS